ncbi:helix-turn-helix transcriptional regulator [Sphingobacterium sp. UT-1RO-CII-1]|uniref:helix-turn-helix domain-containing protein n=1 Tax=Sphingobacterium sp. UT-1RO-CII-1 TaxID=2995225 RepID=UPI00227CE285|nr:helix-turn-helix transcriptional regulator [Sphingobacterium sp. UT-1RO-CII-1]MCY4779075.1 helix-turn-helix transcriptional regulator [Sphingobacterium sp. UT-1RO-CII-1]
MTKIKVQTQENLATDLVTFIYMKFIAPISINGKEPSDRKYQEITSIGRTTINKIKKCEGYDVPFSTISRICKYAEISLSEFFTMFEAYLKEKEAKMEK